MYVIKNKRLKNFLYALGFNYIKDQDVTGQHEFIYLFPNTQELRYAITFYTDFKNSKLTKMQPTP